MNELRVCKSMDPQNMNKRYKTIACHQNRQDLKYSKTNKNMLML